MVLTAGLLTRGVLMVIAVGALLLSRHHRPSLPSESPQDPQDLAKAITTLDLRFGAGEIEAAAYERDRALLKSKLVHLLEDEA